MKKPNLKTYRRTLQITVALAFMVIPYLNLQGFTLFNGNLLSFNAVGIPLADPLSVVQVSLKSWPVPVKLLLAAGIGLLLALFLGTVFCSWICPFGLFSEFVHGLSKRFFSKKYRGIHLRISGFPVKGYLFILCLLGFILMATTPLLNQVSMPGWYSRVFQLLIGQKYLSVAAGVILAALLLEFFTQNRLWCRYFCVQAVLLVLAQLINPFRLKVCYNRQKCGCKAEPEPCVGSCSLSLNPKTLVKTFETECTNCGDCVLACKRVGNALGFQLVQCKKSTPSSHLTGSMS